MRCGGEGEMWGERVRCGGERVKCGGESEMWGERVRCEREGEM